MVLHTMLRTPALCAPGFTDACNTKKQTPREGSTKCLPMYFSFTHSNKPNYTVLLLIYALNMTEDTSSTWQGSVLTC